MAQVHGNPAEMRKFAAALYKFMQGLDNLSCYWILLDFILSWSEIQVQIVSDQWLLDKPIRIDVNGFLFIWIYVVVSLSSIRFGTNL